MSRRGWLGLLGLVGIAGALRFSTLGVQSYWYDEGQTLDVVRMGLGRLLSSGLPDTQNFPPLYFLLAWAWVKAFSLSEVGLRSFSALCGTLTIPAVYAAGSALASRRVGFVAAALAATSPLLIWYSQEARPYALLALLGALSLLYFARAREVPSGRRIAAWAACTGLALLTHYYAVFLAVPEAVLLWIAVGRRRHLVEAIAALSLLGVALLPLALHQHASGRAESIASAPLIDRVRTLPNRFLLGEQGGPLGDYGKAHYLLYPLVLLVLAGVWLVWRRSDEREQGAARTAALLAAAAGIGPVALAVLGYDYVVDRNLILAWAPAALMLACGLGACRSRRVGLALTTVTAALSIGVVIAVTATARLHRADYRGVARALCVPHVERAIVVTPFYSLPPLRYYLPDVRALTGGTGPVAEVDVISMRPAGSVPPLPAILQRSTVTLARTSTWVVARVRLQRPAHLASAVLAVLRVPTQGIGLGRALLLKEPAKAAAHWSSRCTER